MTELNEQLLKFLDENSRFNSLEYALKNELDHQKVVGAIKSLQINEDLIAVEQKSKKEYQLNKEAEGIVSTGSHEFNIFSQIPDEGILQADLMKLPNAKLGFSKAMANGWVNLDKKNPGGPKITKKISEVKDEVQILLKKLKSLDLNDVQEKSIQDLKKRKLVSELTVNTFDVSKGQNFSTKIEKLEVELKPEMLQNNSWKNIKFKELNINARGVLPSSGHLHPLLKVRSEFRKIFTEMGFTEMPTNNYVENSFWNFDALFVPQKHPARDAQDTFFISEPGVCDKFPKDYLERVKNVHINGKDCNSQGYQYDWKYEETQKNVLRTHTTAATARLLYKLGQQETFKPTKFFSIDKVFRNETLDATHLAEFHQIEGAIADRNISLGELIGVFKEFFSKLGMNDLRFKPAYNPYTEPSLEIFAYHKGLKKWIEIGNSGVFRPEMLLPINLPKDVVVFGWGLSLERPTMIKYGLNNIRDLVGHKVNLQMVYDSPICRINK